MNIAKQIATGTREGGKSYAFDEGHDPTQPSQMWFQQSDAGLILFVVFYTQACRWSKCIGCNLPSKSSQHHVGYKAIIAQIDHVFAIPEVLSRRTEIRKIIVSNNGSVLDQATFSSTALIYLMAQINLTFPYLKTLSMETRPEYVDLAELEFLGRALAEGDTPTVLELAIGFEAYDDRIRNEVFQKGITLDKFEAFIASIAPYSYTAKCYVMQKPVPDMTDEEAVADVARTIDYFSRIAREYAVRISMHLNPTYAAHGTPLATHFGNGTYTPPYLIDVARATVLAGGKDLSVFIGLYDEGLAVKGGSFLRDGDEPFVAQLEEFNRIQDFDFLQRAIAEHAPS